MNNSNYQLYQLSNQLYQLSNQRWDQLWDQHDEDHE